MNSFLRCLIKKNHINVREFCSEVSKQSNLEKWDLFVGVSVERLPIITRDLNEQEQKISNILAQIEFENSHKSTFEIRLENDLKRAKDIKEGKIDNTEIDNLPQQTAQDYLDACIEELKAFKFGNRKGDEKEEKNLKSTQRALDRRLLLLINEKIGETKKWILPQGIYKGEDSLRLTAERVLQEKCGNLLNAKFLGNCPCGFYKYKYPKIVRTNSVGAKIFFFKAQLVNGQVDEKICGDYHWATRQELHQLPVDYYKNVRKFLVDEEH